MMIRRDFLKGILASIFGAFLGGAGAVKAEEHPCQIDLRVSYGQCQPVDQMYSRDGCLSRDRIIEAKKTLDKRANTSTRIDPTQMAQESWRAYKPETNEWHHLATTPGGTILYLDGQEVEYINLRDWLTGKKAIAREGLLKSQAEGLSYSWQDSSPYHEEDATVLLLDEDAISGDRAESCIGDDEIWIRGVLDKSEVWVSRDGGCSFERRNPEEWPCDSL